MPPPPVPPVLTLVKRSYRFFLLLTRIPLPSREDTIGEFKEKLQRRLMECGPWIAGAQKAPELSEAIKKLEGMRLWRFDADIEPLF